VSLRLSFKPLPLNGPRTYALERDGYKQYWSDRIMTTYIFVISAFNLSGINKCYFWYY